MKVYIPPRSCKEIQFINEEATKCCGFMREARRLERIILANQSIAVLSEHAILQVEESAGSASDIQLFDTVSSF